LSASSLSEDFDCSKRRSDRDTARFANWRESCLPATRLVVETARSCRAIGCPLAFQLEML